MFIWRPEAENNVSRLKVAKHYGGPVGNANLFFDARLTRFASLANLSELRYTQKMSQVIDTQFSKQVDEFIHDYRPALEALTKGEKPMITVEFKQDGQAVGLMTADLKEFKTGSKGYFGMGKIQIGEKRYQVQVQMVEIGSKPKSETE